MKRKTLLLAVAAAAALLASGCGKKDDRTVAEFDGKKITAGELVLQYRLISAPSRPLFSTVEQKKAFLDILILKEILKSEAMARGLEKRPEVDAGVKAFEDQQLLKDMYVEKGQKPVTVEPAEIEEHYKKTSALVRVRDIWLSGDRAKADQVLKEIRGGADFAEMAKKHSQNEYAANGGDMDWNERSSNMLALFGDALDGMKPGDVSDVLETPAGFHIVQVVEEKPADMAEFEARKMAVRADLRRRKEAKEWQRFTENLRTQANPTAVPENIAIVQERARQTPAGQTPQFSDTEKALPLISYNGGSWTIADLLYFLQSAGPGFRPENLTNPSVDWARWMSGRAMSRVILKAARDLGLDKTASFIDRSQRKREEVMLDLLHEDIVKDVAVTAEEARAFYTSKEDSMVAPDGVNAVFLVCGTQERADSAYAELEAGKPFDAVAKHFSEDPNFKTNGGRLDSLLKGAPGMAEMEEAVFALDPGKWTRPMPVQSRFYIFTVRDKWTGRKLAYEEVAPQIEASLLAQKQAETFDSWVEEKKNSMKIKVNDSALKAIIAEEGGEGEA